jgi:hypothetical protein
MYSTAQCIVQVEHDCSGTLPHMGKKKKTRGKKGLPRHDRTIVK